MILDLKPPSIPVKNRIATVGVELEGGWATEPDRVSIGHDGSVSFPSAIRRNLAIVGEATSQPMAPIGLATWMRRAYPSHVNETCGLHIHLGFRESSRELYYQWLMTPDYQDTLVATLQAWGVAKGFPPDHRLFHRLAGNNTYCEHRFWPDAQARQERKNYTHSSSGHRYTMVNYCYGLHKTLEVRVLPMFDAVEDAIEALHVVIDTTNNVLSKVATRERPVQDTILLNASVAPYRETAKASFTRTLLCVSF